VYTNFVGINDTIDMQTAVHISMFGETAVLPLSCKVSIGREVSVCMDLLTRTLSKTSDSGYSCEIGGQDVPSISYPGVTANFCMDISVKGLDSIPTGTVDGRIEAGVDFGQSSIAGQTFSLGSEAWNPSLFTVGF
jgi:hypothetical protein